MIGRARFSVSGLLLVAANLSAAGAAPTSAPASRPVDATDYTSVAARHIGRLRIRLAQIDDDLGTSDRDEHDRLLIEKMSALFELLALEGRPLDPLDRLASEARSHDPGEALAAAADYWRLRISLLRRDLRTASQPATGWALSLVEQYLNSHPRSPYVAALVADVIESAYAEKNLAAVDRLLDRLKRDLPDHPTTEALLGADRLRRSIGRPMTVALKDTQGRPVDWDGLRGHPTLVLIWAAWDAASMRTLRQIAAWPSFRDPNGAALVVAVSLDRQSADAEATLKELGLRAIVCCDGKSWRSEYVEDWGIRSLPVALILDGSGRLRSVVSGIDSNFALRLGEAWRAAGGRLE